MSATLKARATLDDRPFQTALARMRNRARSVGKGISDAWEGMGVTALGSGSAMHRLGQFAGFAGRKIYQSTNAAIENAAALRKVSKQTGVSVKDLAILEDTFAENGLELSDLAKSLTMMQAKMGKAGGMSNRMRERLKDMGIDVQGFLDAAPAQKFTQLAKGIESIADPTKKVSAATLFLGRAGKALLPVMEDVASVDLGQKDKQAEALERMADKAKLLKQTIAKINDNTSGFGVGLADKTIDLMQSLAEKLEHVTQGAQEAGEAVGDFINKATSGGKELAPMVATGSDPFANFKSAHSRKNDFFDYAAGKKIGFTDPALIPKAGLSGATNAGKDFQSARAIAGSALAGASLSGAHGRVRSGDAKLARMAMAANGQNIGSVAEASHVIRRGDAARSRTQERLTKLEELGLRQAQATEELRDIVKSWDE